MSLLAAVRLFEAAVQAAEEIAAAIRVAQAEAPPSQPEMEEARVRSAAALARLRAVADTSRIPPTG